MNDNNKPLQTDPFDKRNKTEAKTHKRTHTQREVTDTNECQVVTRKNRTQTIQEKNFVANNNNVRGLVTH